MSKYAEILSHEPIAALIDKISAYIKRTHAKYPEIPIDVLWEDLKHDIEAAINQAEG